MGLYREKGKDNGNYYLGFSGYSPPGVDRIWLGAYYDQIPMYPISYLLKTDYRFGSCSKRGAPGTPGVSGALVRDYPGVISRNSHQRQQTFG